MAELKPIIEQAMTQYSGAVLQSRALVDVRDGLKPSARQIFYSMLIHKLTSDKPHKKTMNAVGSAMADFYIHGDSSCEGVIMRAGQNFAMRYPLIDVKGNAGTLISSGSWAAPRYTESRLSKISDLLFADIEKKTINEWRDSYDNTKQYPAVLPSKGFYNLVNGTQGIGVGLASSIPQFNLKEVNEALIYLIQHPDCSFEDIYCAPDFATGGILYNEAEVKESLKNGTGAACKLRSVIDYDADNRCFVVTEIPYNVYTNTICGELEAIVNGEDNPGIERFNDLTGEKPLIKIYLMKKANPDKILKFLYKNTSLQYYYGINLTMLDNGRFPKVFTWKEALQAHINHEIEVYVNGFNYDLKRIKDRLHVLEGLIKAISIIDEVIALIRNAADSANASRGLQQQFGFTEIQAKAILDIKLSRLAHLEITKLTNEYNSLKIEKDRIEAILQNEELLHKEIINGWRDTAQRFGDERRTKIISLSENEGEVLEVKTLQLSLTNKNNLFISEASSLYTQKRGGVGTKFKLEKGEYVISTTTAQTTDSILFFTVRGDFYSHSASALSMNEKLPIEAILPIKDNERICAITNYDTRRTAQNIIFFTKNGMMKKSLMSEYNIKRNIGVKAIELNKNDEIVSVLFLNTQRVGILTAMGQLLWCDTKDVNPIGRVGKGVKSIKLNDGDYVVSAQVLSEDFKEIVSVSANGYTKRTGRSEICLSNRYTKGTRLHKLKDEDDYLVSFLPLNNESEIICVSSHSQIKIKTDTIPLLSKGAQGVLSIKLGEKNRVIALSKN